VVGQCLVDVPRHWPHLSPFGDLLGVLILVTLPSFSPVVVQRLQMGVAGCGLAAECCRETLAPQLEVTPGFVTLRFENMDLLNFAVTTDKRHRPELGPLNDELARLKQGFPDMATIVIEVDDDVPLELLIPIADLCIGAGFPSVMVGPDARSPIPR
jgi:hypothetical protein